MKKLLSGSRFPVYKTQETKFETKCIIASRIRRLLLYCIDKTTAKDMSNYAYTYLDKEGNTWKMEFDSNIGTFTHIETVMLPLEKERILRQFEREKELSRQKLRDVQ